MTQEQHENASEKSPAELWVEALRSGEYEQGRDRLEYEIDGQRYHCCLGVACDLFDRLHPGVLERDRVRMAMRINPFETKDGFKTRFRQTVKEENDSQYDPDSVTTSTNVLPNVVRQWLGLRTPQGCFNQNHDALATLNDSGKNFAYIAEIIERRPEGLFVE